MTQLEKDFQKVLDKIIKNATPEQKRTGRIELNKKVIPKGMLEDLIKEGILIDGTIRESTVEAMGRALAEREAGEMRARIFSDAPRMRRRIAEELNKEQTDNICEDCFKKLEEDVMATSAEVIKNYCGEHKCDDQCRFHKVTKAGQGLCRINGNPVDWMLDEE